MLAEKAVFLLYLEKRDKTAVKNTEKRDRNACFEVEKHDKIL